MAKLLDKTVCRQGKLRPWFILSLPITILSIIMMFAIPDMGAKAQAVWVVISYNLFYSVGYTMWYMAYELSAALSTRNVKQRSSNSIAWTAPPGGSASTAEKPASSDSATPAKCWLSHVQQRCFHEPSEWNYVDEQ